MKTQNVRIGLRMPAKLFKQLSKDAKKQGLSLSAYARKILEKYYE